MADATKPYRPSNGTEGEIFQSAWCQKCSRDNYDPDTGEGGCYILIFSMAYGIDHPDYPKEWVQDEAGPRCTAFSAPEPSRCPDTPDMFSGDQVAP